MPSARARITACWRSIWLVPCSAEILCWVGTADIDLFFIHNDSVSPEREIQRLTDEVHLDIAHHGRDDYTQARNLRQHPWLGYGIINCNIMYDPQHFMDFTQASVRGQFDQPENVLSRVQGQAEHARQIWLALHDRTGVSLS